MTGREVDRTITKPLGILARKMAAGTYVSSGRSGGQRRASAI
jgi:hypothetical protein